MFFSGMYDLQLITRWLLVVAGRCPSNIIRRGRRIISLTACRVRCIDSLSFFNTSLRTLPKTFDLKNESKTDFPHKFNRTENEDYVGRWPSEEFYDTGRMGPEQLTEFQEWFKGVEDKEFRFWDELQKWVSGGGLGKVL